MALIDLEESDEIRAENLLNKWRSQISADSPSQENLKDLIKNAFEAQRILDSQIARQPDRYSDEELEVPSDNNDKLEGYYKGCQNASDTILDPLLNDDEF